METYTHTLSNTQTWMHMPNQREGVSEKEHKKKQQTTHTATRKQWEETREYGSFRQCAWVCASVWVCRVSMSMRACIDQASEWVSVCVDVWDVLCVLRLYNTLKWQAKWAYATINHWWDKQSTDRPTDRTEQCLRVSVSCHVLFAICTDIV